MSDINTFLLLVSVLLTSVWSLVCLQKRNPVAKRTEIRSDATGLFSESRITVEGILTMVPPLEQMKAADF